LVEKSPKSKSKLPAFLVAIKQHKIKKDIAKASLIRFFKEQNFSNWIFFITLPSSVGYVFSNLSNRFIIHKSDKKSIASKKQERFNPQLGT